MFLIYILNKQMGIQGLLIGNVQHILIQSTMLLTFVCVVSAKMYMTVFISVRPT